MAGTGSLVKLAIQAYEDPQFSTLWDDPGNPFTVQINPEKYRQSMAAAYTKDDAAGGTGQASTFDRDLGSNLTLELVFDGTGAVPGSYDKTVDAQILDLWRLGMKINSDKHRPNYLKLSWGTLLFKGQLVSMDIDYTLFSPDGTPLRARVGAKFSKFQENLEGQVEQNMSSPDMTHALTVQAGDTLPLMCFRVYGDSSYYPQVARVNGLAEFRRIAVGTTLAFPPLSGYGA
jgi:nucleoid-associated protein YgaU